MRIRVLSKEKMRQDVADALGARIVHMRRQHGLTQRDFARRCKLHPASMGNIERGKNNLTLNTLLVLAEGLKIKVHKLFKGIA